MKADPSAPGVPPPAVACKNVDKKESFKKQLQDAYQYEVQGGLHSVSAQQSILEENDAFAKDFSKVYALVYINLTDEEALRVASRHNINGHFNHKMTHRDYVR